MFNDAMPTLYLQDLRAQMESQYVEISRWKDFCLENTCSLLKQKFPNSAIWIVRPSRMLRNLFSSFHHFVESSITGVPEYDSAHGAIPHLELLLRDAVHQVVAQGVLEKSAQETLALPLVLIGFSKGCVVLNQIVHELVNYVGLLPSSRSPLPSPRGSPAQRSFLFFPIANMERLKEFVGRIRVFYWLDAGHSGDHGAWVTDVDLLQTLTLLQATIHVHVTPYQVLCPFRPWIGEEKCEFVAKLQQSGATVKETLHFEQEERSLERHFRVLEVF